MWWAGNWNSATQLNFETWMDAGSHVLYVTGGEGCCDGA